MNVFLHAARVRKEERGTRGDDKATEGLVQRAISSNGGCNNTQTALRFCKFRSRVSLNDAATTLAECGKSVVERTPYRTDNNPTKPTMLKIIFFINQ
ncbi:MAG: hypothetical protein LBE79_13345 [Tannerella sp.]|jgi:hypothetical protein|nr:hypothetical protein [Tannerella sp.]